MIKNFICPDGNRIDKNDCLEKCRMDNPCSPKSYLKMVSAEREWKGVPSVTQLLNGTLESYLKIKEDYDISPNDMAFAISGTKKHGNLEEHGENPEQHLVYDGIQGTCDELEKNDDGTYTLIDYKTSGSYKVAQCLGIAVEKTKIPDGFYKNGKEKFLTETEIIQIPGDWGDYAMQLNMYRIMLQETKGIKISDMKIFFVVRDGGIAVARSRGITKNVYFASVPFIEDGKILRFFKEKREDLFSYLNSNTIPPICTQEERWFDRKCQGYCPVREICPRRQGEG